MQKFLALFAVLAVAGLPDARAQDSVPQFYKGRQVTIVVGSPPGGGFDIYARLLGRHIGKYIPGNPECDREQHAGRGQQYVTRARL